MTPTWQLAVDCSDSARLVAFWCEALGYVPEPAPEGWDSWLAYWRAAGIPEDELEGADEGSGAIIDPDGVRPRIWFQEVPEAKSGKNRLHLDIRHTPGREAMPYAERKASVDAEVERLVALGATVAYVNAPEGADHYAMTLRDPEGNEFCVV
ncbi:VOC family protein [Pedococcus bigeumensis]|uniref:VOC family protein n=1 Tax=Pedococcus bigeumensis TaxID=433644 RepID=A0A502CQT0_9MICO|nr:VOC family protein [Pedococcus bigeumensis]TPG15102.1 VOC family protein [Pedococcus bigeumensis]